MEKNSKQDNKKAAFRLFVAFSSGVTLTLFAILIHISTFRKLGRGDIHVKEFPSYLRTVSFYGENISINVVTEQISQSDNQGIVINFSDGSRVMTGGDYPHTLDVWAQNDLEVVNH